MKAQLILELKMLAEKILQLENDQEIDLLKEKIQNIYDRVTILDYLNKNPETPMEVKIETTEIVETAEIVEEIKKEEIVEFENHAEEIEDVSSENIEETSHIETSVEEKVQVADDLFIPTFDSIKDDFSQKEEFKDTISLDETEKMFETKKEQQSQLSLNDRLVNNSIQVGLNDRIAFVNNLFNFSQLEFNKELSVLNNFNNEIEAKNYIQHQIKSKYNWEGKEEIEERFMQLVERKFL